MTNKIKNAIRTTCKQVRENLPEDYQKKISTQICAMIRQLHEYRYAKRIALYHAIKGEVDLSLLWQSAPGQGKFCYFPTLHHDKSLAFLPATPATLFKLNRYGISEPDVNISEACDPNTLDIIFVPLVAFDAYCNRIGMGGGHYDRTLEKLTRPLLIGVAYDFQYKELIVPEPWDVTLTAIITQSKIYWRKS